MLDFRKWFLALAVVALIAIPASAQPLSCFAQATGTPSIRSEGITELVGDVLIDCTGGTPIAPTQILPQVNIQVFTTSNINITSKIISSPWMEALLFMDEPSPAIQTVCGSTAAPEDSGNPGVCTIRKPYDNSSPYAGGYVTDTSPDPDVRYPRPNAWQGRQLSNNSIIFQGIPIDPPGTLKHLYIRITNIRVNAAQLNVPAGAQAAVGVFISTSPSGVGNPITLPITNPAPTVAFAQSAMTFQVRNTVSGAAEQYVFLQCVSENSSFVSDRGKCPTSRLSLRYTENFNTAFKRRNLASPGVSLTAVPPIPVSQNNFAAFSSAAAYNSETGFYSTDSTFQAGSRLPAMTAGLADHGTRLLARFNNVPAGVEIWVRTANYLVNTLSTSTRTGVARLVTTDSNGAGPFSATPAGACSDLAQVSIIGGSGWAVWEIVETDSTATERTDIPVYIAYVSNTTSNLPALGKSTVNGTLAPVSSVTTASATAPIPRFVDVSSALDLFSINACVTNLLFPFVTNQAGFDTGLVISNTSLDPYGTGTQAGACEIYYYGQTTGGGSAPATQTSTTVAAGSQLVWTLSSGGTNNITATPGFQGYIIARCYFQYAHGFAFMSDLGAAKLAHGYLALVLDDDIPTRTGSMSEVLGM